MNRAVPLGWRVFSIRRAAVKRFGLSSSPAVEVFFAGSRFSSGSALWALPSWDQKDEAAQSDSRPDRRVRSAQDSQRTRFIDRPAKDIFPPVGGTCLSPVCLLGPAFFPVSGWSGGYGGVDLPGPTERGAVAPYAMHDHRQPTSQGDDGLLEAAPPGNVHGPGFQP